MHGRRGVEIVELIGLGEVAQRGAFSGEGLDCAFISRIGSEPEVTAQEGVVVFDGEVLEIVAGSSKSAGGEVAVIEMVAADAHVDIGLPKLLLAARDEAA